MNLYVELNSQVYLLLVYLQKSVDKLMRRSYGGDW